MSKLKEYIYRKMIDYCCKKALKYDQRKEMLLLQKDIKFFYAIGSNVMNRDKWFNRIKKIQNRIIK